MNYNEWKEFKHVLRFFVMSVMYWYINNTRRITTYMYVVIVYHVLFSLLNGRQERDQVRSRRRAHADDNDEWNESVVDDF